MVRLAILVLLSGCWRGDPPPRLYPEFVYVRDPRPPCRALVALLGRRPQGEHSDCDFNLEYGEYYYCRLQEVVRYTYELEGWIDQAVEECGRER